MGIYLPDGGRVKVISTLTVLPELVKVDCKLCRGEGWLPSSEDTYNKCYECGGSGKVEACPVCHERPQVVKGLEVCGCNRA